MSNKRKRKNDATLNESNVESDSSQFQHLHVNQKAYQYLYNKNSRYRCFTEGFRAWHFFEFHIVRVKDFFFLQNFNEVWEKLKIPLSIFLHRFG